MKVAKAKLVHIWSTHSGIRMYDLTRSESCSMHTSCFGEPRIPSAKTPLDIGTPIGPKQLRSAPMAFNKMSSEELRVAKLWYDEDGKTPLEISQLLRRDISTITRHGSQLVTM